MNDGSGGFGTQQIISVQTDGLRSVFTADLDADGDIDVLSASQSDNKIAWYENDGNGSFGPQLVISSLADSPRDLFASDLDNDGDLDLLTASYWDDTIAWYENDGTGAFGPSQTISLLADGASYVFAADLNGDGHHDVLSASTLGDKVSWYANDGTGNFGPEQIIAAQMNYLRGIFVHDLNGDGDMDVLSASDDVLAWYENLTIVDGIFNLLALSPLMHPNPLVHHAIVELPSSAAVSVQLLDARGRLLRVERVIPSDQRFVLQRQELSPGAYVLHMTWEEGHSAVRFMVE